MQRRNQQRVNTIRGYIPSDVLPSDAIKAWNAILLKDPIKVPTGYKIELGGEQEKRNEAMGNLVAYLPALFILLLSVLVLTFSNLRMVFILLLVIFQSYSMGLLSLFMSGYAFGFQVIIGLIGLIGLAINAAIIILNEIVENPAAKKGDIQALTDSVQVCLRHIISTTLTTIAGFMPLILSGGLFWPPFAYAIAGGTLLTTTLSLFLVPCLYRVLYLWRQ